MPPVAHDFSVLKKSLSKLISRRNAFSKDLKSHMKVFPTSFEQGQQKGRAWKNPRKKRKVLASS
jgi:hypothetical protein